MFDKYDIEEIILGMADIVYENRRLRAELKRAQEYEKKYDNLLNRCVDNANKSSAAIFEAIMLGCYNTGGKKEENANDQLTQIWNQSPYDL